MLMPQIQNRRGCGSPPARFCSGFFPDTRSKIRTLSHPRSVLNQSTCKKTAYYWQMIPLVVRISQYGAKEGSYNLKSGKDLVHERKAPSLAARMP